MVGRIIAKFVAVLGRWRLPLLAIWLLVMVVAGILAAQLPDRLSGGGWFVQGSQSEHVANAQSSGFVGLGKTTITAVVRDELFTAKDPNFESRIRGVLNDLRQDPELEASSQFGWSTFAGETERRFVGKDGRTVTESFGLALDDGKARRIMPIVQQRLTDKYEGQELSVQLVGTAPFWGEVNTLSASGLMRAELIALPLILLILLLLFRSVVATLMSLVVGVTALVLTLALLTVIASRIELSIFVQNTASMLALGVGIDYSLFVIRRFRDELAAGQDVEAALAKSLRTSGATVVASGITIVAAMATLVLVKLPAIQSIALGASLVVAISVLTSVLVLPLLLRIVGHGINRGTIGRRKRSTVAAGTSGWIRYADWIMRRPVAVLLASVLLLGLAAVPAIRMNTFTPDAGIIPSSSAARTGFDRIEEQFGRGDAAPLRVLVESDRPLTDPSVDQAGLLGLVAKLGALPDVVRVDSALSVLSGTQPLTALASVNSMPAAAAATVRHFVSEDLRSTIVDLVPDAHPASDASQALLDEARRLVEAESPAGMRVSVGGQTAEGVDANQVVTDSLPGVVLIMLAVMYLLLMLTFRSVLLPLKAIVINLISVSATYGVLVLVFQDGHGAGLLGFDASGHLTHFVPILLLALLFSLSTDYEVFVLSRAKEFYQEGMSNTRSVSLAIASTGPLISGAALLMVAVFGAFSLIPIVPMQELGVGMAVAIALDATLVRLAVVPAAMRLMGDLNWWFPGSGRRRSVPAAGSAGPAGQPSTDRQLSTEGSLR
ncbi:MMPL family transporter [Nocardia tengchongensis]|uniref:MMPL family transporter n=1 Tax=Nocardia tengchongensis TaxID=2055889 RepID=UPI0036AA96E3